MDIKEIIEKSDTIDAVTQFFQNSTQDQRVDAIRSLNKRAQEKLFALAQNTAPLDLNFFVPPSYVNTEVIHEGKNSLPLFTLFQKRFVRASDSTVFGYNHNSTMGIVGPGYFIAKECSGVPTWQDRGSVVIDYYEKPTQNTPSHWPQIKDNGDGLQRLVYYHMHDFMRRVSEHVSIGLAYKDDKSINSFFVLCRLENG